MISRLSRDNCLCRFSSLLSSLAYINSQGGGGGEAHRHAPLAGGQAQPQGDVGLAGATVADGDKVRINRQRVSREPALLTSAEVMAISLTSEPSLSDLWCPTDSLSDDMVGTPLN